MFEDRSSDPANGANITGLTHEKQLKVGSFNKVKIGGQDHDLDTGEGSGDSDYLIAKGATKLGEGKALKGFFSKLERLGVGTRRAEMMASDIVWQNVLKYDSEENKKIGKKGQERKWEEVWKPGPARASCRSVT